VVDLFSTGAGGGGIAVKIDGNLIGGEIGGKM
jgi:hypothetical protein